MEICVGEISGDDDSNVKTMSFEVDQTEAKKFKLGTPVEIIIHGVVGMLEIPPEDLASSAEKRDSSSMGIRVTSRSITRTTEQEAGIKDLAEDEDA